MTMWIRFLPACLAVLLAAVVFCPVPGMAADEATRGEVITVPEMGSGTIDGYVAALRSDIQAKKRKIIEANMPLTEREAKLFWPVYDRYDYDMGKVNFERASIYDFYVDNYKTMSNKQAKDLLRRLNNVDRLKLSIDQKYGREMGKVLPAKTVLRFVQITRQVDRLVGLKIMSGIPLVPVE